MLHRKFPSKIMPLVLNACLFSNIYGTQSQGKKLMTGRSNTFLYPATQTLNLQYTSHANFPESHKRFKFSVAPPPPLIIIGERKKHHLSDAVRFVFSSQCKCLPRRLVVTQLVNSLLLGKIEESGLF